MKFKLLICLLVSGLVSQIQAFSVINNLPVKKVVIENIVYHVGSVDFPLNRTVRLDPGEAWYGDQQANSTASCHVSVGKKDFDFDGLLYNNIITFFLDENDKTTYSITTP